MALQSPCWWMAHRTGETTLPENLWAQGRATQAARNQGDEMCRRKAQWRMAHARAMCSESVGREKIGADGAHRNACVTATWSGLAGGLNSPCQEGVCGTLSAEPIVPN